MNAILVVTFLMTGTPDQPYIHRVDFPDMKTCIEQKELVIKQDKKNKKINAICLPNKNKDPSKEVTDMLKIFVDTITKIQQSKPSLDFD